MLDLAVPLLDLGGLGCHQRLLLQPSPSPKDLPDGREALWPCASRSKSSRCEPDWSRPRRSCRLPKQGSVRVRLAVAPAKRERWQRVHRTRVQCAG